MNEGPRENLTVNRQYTVHRRGTSILTPHSCTAARDSLECNAMAHPPWNDFESLVRLPEHQVRLAAAALHLARDEYPTLDVRRCLDRLDALAAQVAALSPAKRAKERLVALRTVLVERERFRGNDDDYYDPRNSYLCDVLDRRVGIPITLATLWLDVAAQLRWPLVGIGMPGRFLVGYRDSRRTRLIDVFDGGREVTQKDCRSILASLYGSAVRLEAEHLQPVGNHAILTRMLCNLRGLYMKREDWCRAERVLRRLLALHPDCGDVLGDLGLVTYRLGRYADAADLLHRALQQPEVQPSTRSTLTSALTSAVRRWANAN